MSPEKRYTPEIENPTTLQINWRASKSTVSGFTTAALNYEYSRNEEFRLKVGRNLLEGLLYDLGHAGRNMDDFPFKIPLTIPKPIEKKTKWRPENPNLVSTMTFPHLYNQLTDQIENYIVETYRKRDEGIFSPRPDAFQREINALRELTEQSREKSVTITFVSFDEIHDISKMVSEDYEYQDPHFYG